MVLYLVLLHSAGSQTRLSSSRYFTKFQSFSADLHLPCYFTFKLHEILKALPKIVMFSL